MVALDFENYNKKGLQSLLQKLEKAGLPVKDVVADNKSKRENGYAVKSATLTFESGQSLVLKIKAGGSLYQTKLNGKVLAIKNYIKAETFTDEVMDYVKANEPAYKKNKEKAMSRVRVVAPKVKAVNTSIAEQVTVFSTTLEEIKGQTEAVRVQLDALTNPIAAKLNALGDLQNQIDAENSKSTELQLRLETLKSGIMESAYFPKAGSPEYVVQKAGFTMVQDEGRILGFRDFGKTGKMVPAVEYKNIPKEVLKAMKAVIQDDLDYEDEDGKHPFHLDAPIKHIFEAAGTAPVQIDRIQIANDMMHGDGRHPKLKAAFVEGFNNSCSITDAIAFIESFSDEELMKLMKDEENIFEGVELKAEGKIARLTKQEFLAYIQAPEEAVILEAVDLFNAHQEEQGMPVRAMILECGDTSMGEGAMPNSVGSEVIASPDQRGTYAERSETTGWNVFQDTTILSPFTYPVPAMAALGARGDCHRCGADMEAYGTGKICPSCGLMDGMDSMIVESGTEVTLKGHRTEGDILAGKTAIIMESVPTVDGPYYKAQVDGLIYRGIPSGMILEAVGQDTSIDRSGEHDINDPKHVDDPDHENYGDKKKPCPWCGSDVHEERCIACDRQYPMATADRAAWVAANRELKVDEFPEDFE